MRFERKESRLGVQQLADALGTGVCALALATKKWPGAESPFDSVMIASMRSFSTRNSEAAGSVCMDQKSYRHERSEHEDRANPSFNWGSLSERRKRT